MESKMSVKWLAGLMVILLLAITISGCSGDDKEADRVDSGDDAQPPTSTTMPADLKEFVDSTLAATADEALKLDGAWGDWHKAMIDSGQGRSYEGYEEHMKVLRDYQVASGAYYVYTLYTTDADAPEYTIAVDASVDPDEFGEGYDWEIQFKEAWEGKPAAARSAWDNADDGEKADLCWSAFAPIKDSAGNVVAILGVDMPAPLALNYPEWNRDSDDWNEVED